MHEQLARDRRPELRRVREAGLRGLAGAVLLRQNDLVLGGVRSAPLPHLSLQRAQLALVVAVRVLVLEQSNNVLA